MYFDAIGHSFSVPAPSLSLSLSQHPKSGIVPSSTRPQAHCLWQKALRRHPMASERVSIMSSSQQRLCPNRHCRLALSAIILCVSPGTVAN